jgi:DnaK suppressor protein
MKRSPESLESFRQKLLAQQALLQSAMRTAVTEGRQTTTDDLQDAADQAVQSYQKELIFLQGSKGHSQLSEVRAALDRLDQGEDGEFGECQQCGNPIGEKRLEAVPWTAHCIACQEKIENGEIADPIRAA